MLLYMLLQLISSTRSVIAVFALEGFFGEMNTFMADEMTFLDKGAVTDLAGMRADGQMSAEVGRQLALLGRRVIALVELTVKHVARMYPLVRN